MADLSCMLRALTVRRPLPLNISCASLKSTALRSSSPILHFKADYRTVNVDARKIVYVESLSEYIKIYLSDSEEPHVVLYSLKHLTEQLPPSRFMRIHRSYIIALEHIAEASHSSVLLDNGKTLPVGEVYRRAFAEYLASC